MLGELEIFYIKEFDSFHNGLNLTNGGEFCGYGEGVHSAKHLEKDYVAVLTYLAETNYSFAKIAELTGVSRDIIKHISSGHQHGYLSNKYPELYATALLKKYTRDNSAKAKGITYPQVRSPIGGLYTVENIHKFCEMHGLQYQNLHKVLTKQRKSHKGWTLV